MAFHSFSPDMAQKFGLAEAIMIQYFQMWIERNKVRKLHHFDDHTWTYNSVNSFTSIFTYFSSKQIRTALDHLVKAGVLLKGNYNKTGYDRTSWYCFADEQQFLYSVKCEKDDTRDFQAFALPVTSISPTRQMDSAAGEDGEVHQGEPIPSIIHINTEEGSAASGPAVAIKKSRAANRQPAERTASKDAAQTTIEDRGAAFRSRMMKFRDDHPQKYPIPFFEIFFQHWTQPSPEGMMKFEAEDYFGLDIRMENFWRKVSNDDKKRYWQEHNDWLRQFAQKNNKSVNDIINHISRNPQPELFH